MLDSASSILNAASFADCLSSTVSFTSCLGCPSSDYIIERIEPFVLDSYFGSFIPNEDSLQGFNCSWRLSLRSRPAVGSCQAFAMGLERPYLKTVAVAPCCSNRSDLASVVAPRQLLAGFRYSFG